MYLILEGVVRVVGRDEHGEEVEVCRLQSGECCGELEFINGHRTVADVIADGPVRCAKLNRRHFEMCMGPIVDILAKVGRENPKYEYYQVQLKKHAK